MGRWTNNPYYRIVLIRTAYNHYYWVLYAKGSDRRIAESRIYTSKEMCMECLNKLNKTLQAKIEFKDILLDYE